ncbi:hypothetical protein [Cupriavidus sp. IK-TO18]|uniref:hypothetical protein n=1 Tax=Cupriavidus sp. IK-TO18 TaxID=2782182 RepID=UPI00189836CD|nr:hypothetical protein [Cupriavidus sp. IK-TO18]MBF6989426.1 hypothetical protein [Cupriavidus sp. IK-TO18]
MQEFSSLTFTAYSYGFHARGSGGLDCFLEAKWNFSTKRIFWHWYIRDAALIVPASGDAETPEADEAAMRAWLDQRHNLRLRQPAQPEELDHGQ